MKKPNVLLILCDQMNPFLSSPYGDKVAVMPHVDRLADEGVVFENAYCNNPLCVPSRASLMTGKLISEIRCAYDNGSIFNSEIPTFAHMFDQAGYATALSGKMHFIGPDQLHGFKERLTQDVYPEDLICTPDGFGADPESHADYGPRLLRENGVSDWNMQIQYDEETHFQALKRLRKFGADDRPFFFTVSYTNPHSPFLSPKRFYDLYEGVDIDLPDVPEDIEGALDFYNAYLAHDFGFTKPSDDVLRRIIRSYYGQYSYIDDKVGSLMDALEREGLADDTIVIFASDHGEMMGRKGMFEKRTFFEDSVRVPLVIRAPERLKPRRVCERVSLVDLFPTFVEWAGSDWPTDDLDGTSLSPLMATDRPAAVEERPIVTEYYGESVCTPFKAVVLGDLKYVHFPDEDERDMLFDLANDPEESRNVIGEERYRDAANRLLGKVTDGFDYGRFKEEIEQSLRNRKLILRGVRDPSERPWRFFPEARDIMWH